MMVLFVNTATPFCCNGPKELTVPLKVAPPFVFKVMTGTPLDKMVSVVPSHVRLVVHMALVPVLHTKKLPADWGKFGAILFVFTGPVIDEPGRFVLLARFR
jgi:hypothetical protein